MRTLGPAVFVLVLALGGIAANGQGAVTATCKDGTSYSGTTRSGACARHGGVQSYGSSDSTRPATASQPQASTTSRPAPKSAAPAAPATSAAAASQRPSSGQVWVNSASKVYHCPGDRYYGKTKAGSYMTETAAKAAGDRPSGGKACS
jgi:hypothetical protein